MFVRLASACMLLLLTAGIAFAQQGGYTILTENAPPTNFVDDNGELKGSSVEIVNEILERIELDTEI